MNFRRAADFLEGEQILDLADVCLEKGALCLIELDDFKTAGEVYFRLAVSCTKRNLRMLCTNTYLCRALLCEFTLPYLEGILLLLLCGLLFY